MTSILANANAKDEQPVPSSDPSARRAAFAAEVLRINDRYVGEFIEHYNLCPFARLTRERGALYREIVWQDDADHCLATLAAWEQQPALEIGMLIFPRTTLDPLGFDRFAQRLRERYETPRGVAAPFVLAPFHRRANFGQKTPAQMTMFWRRAPDPFIQVVPIALLRSVKGQNTAGKFLFDGSPAAFAELERRNRHKPLSEHIAHDNFKRLQDPGLAALEATLEAIFADRDRSYARFDDALETRP